LAETVQIFQSVAYLHKALFNERDEHVLKTEVCVNEDKCRVAKSVENLLRTGKAVNFIEKYNRPSTAHDDYNDSGI
jgi:hypothetical protein